LPFLLQLDEGGNRTEDSINRPHRIFLAGALGKAGMLSAKR